jgi:hypothetical protein
VSANKGEIQDPRPRLRRARYVAGRLTGFVLLVVSAATARAAEIREDETVLFFPTFATPSPAGGWDVHVHGIVFERGEWKRTTEFLRKRLQKKTGELSDAERATFEDRVRPFFADNERFKRVTIRIGESAHTLDRSKRNGHFRGTVHIGTNAIVNPDQTGWIPFSAVLPESDSRAFHGKILCVPATGVSVVSDVDDTIKISDVLDRKKLMQNTFAKPFEPVSGMPELYQRWGREKGVTFHYVSASPWQLFEPISGFLQSNSFPAGTFHMREFRWKDRSLWRFLKSPEKYKRAEILSLLEAFPRREFVLVGDSGEKDPEIYGTLAAENPRIKAVYIRDVTGEEAGAPRYIRAFAGVARERWRIFKDPAAIQGALP